MVPGGSPSRTVRLSLTATEAQDVQLAIAHRVVELKGDEQQAAELLKRLQGVLAMLVRACEHVT